MIWLFVVAFIVLFVLIIYDQFKGFIFATIYMHKLPEPQANFFVGNMSSLFDTPENIFKILRKWGRDYYPIYHTWVAHLSAVNIVNPYDFEIIMSNMKHNTKGYFYHMFHNWLGTGLLTSEGSKWQERRKILTPAFHFNILQEFIKVFEAETKNLVDVFKQECHKPYIAITDFISDFTLDTIETAMGTNFKEENIKVSGRDYKTAIHEIGKIYVYRLSHPWLLHNLFYVFVPQYFKEKKLIQTLHTFTTNVISNRQRNFRSIKAQNEVDFSYSKRKRLAMLDLLLAAKKQEGCIDDGGIREEVDTFMFEGHDTTSVAISYALMLIACHRDIQDRIYEEIQQVVPESSQLNYQILQDLKYMEMCIKEVLRMYPSAPLIARVLGEDIKTHSGYILKTGSMVQLHIYDVHHNPDIYPNPEKFDPDRFLPENCQNRHNFAYVPFSAGPRNCIGQKFAILEIKAVLCGILAAFILEPVDTPETVELIGDVVLRSKDNIKVKFIPRKNVKV
ncbi:cytochrome P450 4C1-like isoform X2 [Zophobas morio]|uniref:cytochrome P450 4C1-like isoform X2 n=1 Tax=Zophobas morio TaxID=2755281 RepID=UPI0030827F6B